MTPTNEITYVTHEAWAAERLRCIHWRLKRTIAQAERARAFRVWGTMALETLRARVLLRAAESGLRFYAQQRYPEVYALVNEAERFHMRAPNTLIALLK